MTMFELEPRTLIVATVVVNLVFALAAAERARYQAKTHGKNRTESVHLDERSAPRALAVGD